MDYRQLMFLHLATVVPCLFLGPIAFIASKGNRLHRQAGRAYLVLMMATAITTACMPAVVGPRLFGHFGFIHLFSLLTFFAVPRAYFAIKRGDIRVHKYSMIGLYVGAILIAGVFTLAPGRFLHAYFFSCTDVAQSLSMHSSLESLVGLSATSP